MKVSTFVKEVEDNTKRHTELKQKVTETDVLYENCRHFFSYETDFGLLSAMLKFFFLHTR